MVNGDEREQRLAQARALVRALEAGEDLEAERIIEELDGGDRHDRELFVEVGRLTRELHEAINGFLLDARISELAHQEIPDASERLQYVITKTEESANKTLNAVEASLPMVESLEQSAQRLSHEWRRFVGRELSREQFVDLSDQIARFLDHTRSDAETLHGRLSEVLMAQDFQDLTGQIIRRVINLVRDVEEKLIKMLSLSGEHRPADGEPEPKARFSGRGPAVPGLDDRAGEVVGGQDDVDDLLSSLGF